MMIAAHRRLILIAATLGLLSISGGCGEEENVAQFRGFASDRGKSSSNAETKKKRAAEAREKEDADPKKIELPPLTENHFVKDISHRDPFQMFPQVLVRTVEADVQTVQQDVKLRDYDIADLKLIAIITNIGNPRAMVVTPDGTGFVIKRGDLVGRPDLIDKSGQTGEKMQVHWRVWRIHGNAENEEDRGVLFVRDDPTTTRGVDMKRFLSLHPRE